MRVVEAFKALIIDWHDVEMY